MKSPKTTVDSRLSTPNSPSYSQKENFRPASAKFPHFQRDFWFQFALPISFSTVAARNLREFSNGLSPRDTIFIYLFCIIIYRELQRRWQVITSWRSRKMSPKASIVSRPDKRNGNRTIFRSIDFATKINFSSPAMSTRLTLPLSI